MEVEQNVDLNPGNDAEAQAWAALEEEYGGDDGAAEGEGGADGGLPPAGEPVAADTAAGEKESDPRAEGEGGPKPEDLTRQYQAAMREERVKRQQLEAKLNEFTRMVEEARARQAQASEPQPPSLDEDPIEHFRYHQEQLASQQRQLAEVISEQQAAYQQQQQVEQFKAALQREQNVFAEKTPDYNDAIDFLIAHKNAELSVFIPDGPEGDWIARTYGMNSAAELRAAQIENEAMQWANTAWRNEKSPADLFYRMAAARGYQKAPPQQQAPAPQRQIEMARAGVQRAQSLSGSAGGGGKSDNISADELADLALSDPEQFDKLFDKLAARGALG